MAFGRERASAWVKAVTPPSAPPIPARSRQRSATIGLGIQTNPNSQVTPYSPSAAAAASAAQPMLSQTFALMFPGHRFDAYSNTHQRCLRHASSLPTLRHHHTSSSPPSLVASNKSSASSASSMISASSSYSATQHRHPKLLKKAQSFAAMRARPLQPLVTLEQELAKSSNPDARTSNTPSFFQKLLKNPSQAALQIRPHTRKTGIKKPDSRSNNNTRRSELPVITDENQPVTKKGSRDQENKTGFKSKAHNTLQRVMSKNKQSPTLPWSVGIVPPADVARRPKHSLIGSTGPIRGPRPAKLARAPLPRIIVDDYDEDE